MTRGQPWMESMKLSRADASLCKRPASLFFLFPLCTLSLSHRKSSSDEVAFYPTATRGDCLHSSAGFKVPPQTTTERSRCNRFHKEAGYNADAHTVLEIGTSFIHTGGLPQYLHFNSHFDCVADTGLYCQAACVTLIILKVVSCHVTPAHTVHDLSMVNFDTETKCT